MKQDCSASHFLPKLKKNVVTGHKRSKRLSSSCILFVTVGEMLKNSGFTKRFVFLTNAKVEAHAHRLSNRLDFVGTVPI